MFVKLRYRNPGDAYCNEVSPDWSQDCPERLKDLTGPAMIELLWVPVDGQPCKEQQQPVAVKLHFRKHQITIWSYAIRSFDKHEEGFVLYFVDEQVDEHGRK